MKSIEWTFSKSRTSQNKFSILKIGPISRVSAFSSKLSSQTIIKDQKELFTKVVFLFLVQGNWQGLKFFENPHGIFFKLEYKLIKLFHLFFKWHFWKVIHLLSKKFKFIVNNMFSFENDRLFGFQFLEMILNSSYSRFKWWYKPWVVFC